MDDNRIQTNTNDRSKRRGADDIVRIAAEREQSGIEEDIIEVIMEVIKW
jgi:hypothetical protein